MSPIFVAIAIAFINGQPVDSKVLGVDSSYEHCVEVSKTIAAQIVPMLKRDVQFEVKCLDYSSAERAISTFGADEKHGKV